MKILTHIIALDPSGAYNEGKGHTGAVLYNCVEHRLQLCRTIAADSYTCDTAYWQAHLDLIDSWRGDHKAIGVVIEDYLLYANKAGSQINSRMETSQLIGVLKLYCAAQGIPYRLQPASAVKLRWTNDILLYKGFITPKMHVSRHVIDAVRHAVHTAEFYNKGEDEAWLGYTTLRG